MLYAVMYGAFIVFFVFGHKYWLCYCMWLSEELSTFVFQKNNRQKQQTGLKQHEGEIKKKWGELFF